MDKQTLLNFSNLALKIGVNLQKGQRLEIACPIEKHEVAHAIAEKAYEMGASYVRIRWEDEQMEKLNYLNCSDEILGEVPKWLILNRNELIEKDYCYIAISAENPLAFKDVPAEKPAISIRAKGKALKKYSDAVMNNAIRWCVVSVPTKEWAMQVFPGCDSPEIAEQKLGDEIFKSMRLDCPNPTLEWENHVNKLNSRASFLNNSNFEYLEFKNNLGTNLKVGLCQNHQWLSAMEKARDGLNFVANLPTEEVFTAPHRLKVEGVVHASLPLNYNGQLVEDFKLEFKKGKIVDFSAKKGYDTLKQIITTDSGTFRIGEVALIGKNSPIAKSNILFYNTLFDENASCHLALGKAYPTTIKGGNELSKKELKSLGANDSIDHIDFMIGTPDLIVNGITYDNKVVKIFEDGEWIID